MLCWVTRVNKFMLLALTVGSMAALCLFELLNYKLSSYDSPFQFLQFISQMESVMLILLALVMCNSLMLTINEKRKRESFLMLPATNLEKYLALMVYSSVVCMACALLALVVGDAFRMLWFWISTPEGVQQVSVWNDQNWYWWSSSVPMLVDSLFPSVLSDDPKWQCSDVYVAMSLAVIIGAVLWTHSLMTLGGTLVRKYAFIITAAVFILCITLFVKFMHYYKLNMFTASWEDGGYVTQDVGTMGYVLAVVLPLLAIFNYWASFRIFKGFEIITNKWINYDFHK